MEESEPSLLDSARADQDGVVQSEQERLISEHYRRAARRLSLLLSRNSFEPVRLSEIRVVGSPHTRQDFLRRVLRTASSQREDVTLSQCLDNLAHAADRLDKFGIYDSVRLELDSATRPDDDVESLSATFRLKERSRMWFRTGTDFGNQEGNAYASANMRNVFGGAESLEGNVTFGTRTKTSYEVKFTTPMRGNPESLVDVTAYAATRINSYASHDEQVHGVSAKWRHLGRFGLHEVGVVGVDRQVGNIHDGASFSIRQCAGVTRKLSLLSSFVRDRRQGGILPTSGYRLRSLQEVALAGLLGSDAAFVKIEVDGSHHTALTADRKSTFNLAFRSGMLWSGKADKSSLLSDRFQLGGPQSVRGFMYNGLGPRDGKDSLGGDAYLATGASFMTLLPGAPDSWPLKLHSFINTGSLIDLNRHGVRSRLLELIKRPSVSAGIGLAFEHPMARVEVSFCLPLACRSSDRPRKGLQFGLGVDFL